MDVLLAIAPALKLQVTQFTVAFLLAWKVVRRDVKKELREQFTVIAGSIDALTVEFAQAKDAVAKDFKLQSERLGMVENGVSDLRLGQEQIVIRVEKLETK